MSHVVNAKVLFLSFTLQKESAPDVFTKKQQGVVNEEENEYWVMTVAVPAGNSIQWYPIMALLLLVNLDNCILFFFKRHENKISKSYV